MGRSVRYLARAQRLGVLALVLSLLLGGAPAVLAMPVEPGTLGPLWSGEANSDPGRTPARRQIIIYTVGSGDALWTIAARFGLDVDTLRWSNPEVARNPDILFLGQELVVLPIPGAYVTVQPGDTVEKLAARWGVAPRDISNYHLNGLRSGKTLVPGMQLVIPHGRREVNLAPPDPAPGYTYTWPIRGGVNYGYSARHRAVDIGAPYGAKVYASRAGTCISATWSEVGYGYLVILRHEDGERTYYGHLKGAWVNPGDWVPRGGLVGEVGSTGNSTGPHVHFEIRVGGVPQNPLDYLPPAP